MSTAAIERLRVEVSDLVAQHSRAKGIQAFARYADDPAGFIRDVLRGDPWSRQVEMAEAVRDHRRVVIVTANGIGKDWVSARAALWWVYARRGLVILTGPTERQVKQILMREVRKAFAAAPELPGELYALELRVDAAGECGILAFTSGNTDRLTGFHHPRLLIGITEGQGVEDPAWEAAQACATAPGNVIFAYGNPVRPTGSFARAAESDHWHLITIPATEHPNVVTGREEIPGAVSREWVEMMRDEYGEASPIYQSRVLSRFPTQSVEGLVKREWIRAAFSRHAATVAIEKPMTPMILAVDVARYGPDATVVAVAQGGVVRELITWRGASIVETADRVIAEADRRALPRYGISPRLVVDDAGLGAGVTDVLRRRGYGVVAFNGAARSDRPERFLNLRAEAHMRFRHLLETGALTLPPDPALEEEALAVEWQVATNGSVQIVGKDLLRKTLGRSPDRLDAVVMALWYSMRGASFAVSRFQIA